MFIRDPAAILVLSFSAARGRGCWVHECDDFVVSLPLTPVLIASESDVDFIVIRLLASGYLPYLVVVHLFLLLSLHSHLPLVICLQVCCQCTVCHPTATLGTFCLWCYLEVCFVSVATTV